MATQSKAPVYRFGSFEVNVESGELRKNGMRLRLSGQPFQVLAILLERKGEVVSREVLHSKLWAADTFVDFDHGLNNAIARIREMLDDSSNTPRYIETIPRRGYRFMAPVEGAPHAVSALETAPSDNPSQSPPPAEKGTSLRLGHALASAVVLTVVLAAFMVYQVMSKKRLEPSPIRSLAVLPLKNLSGDPGQDYFADGMTESLTTELAQISALKVISHTSVEQYKGTKKSLPQIAQELGVDGVVEGAVQRSGDKVEITVQLIQAPSDRHLWAKSYERNLHDVLELQREVTYSITDEIKAKLTPPEKIRLASAPSIDSQPYEDYLKGRFLLEKGDIKKSIEYFQEAIQKNPKYALAYAGLANAYISLAMPWGGDISPNEVLPQAKAAAMRALAIDDSLAEAHLALARVIQLYDWDWPTVEMEYRRALELNPNDAMAHDRYGEYLQEMGRNEEASAQTRQAMALAPLNPAAANDLGDTFYTARQYDQAIRAFQKALEMEPDFVDAHVGLGWVYEEKKMYPEAIAELEKAADLSKRHDLVVGSLGNVLAKTGRTNDAMKLLEELKRRSEHRYVSPCLIALVQIGLGERDEAIASLEQGYSDRDQWMLYLKVDPHLDDLRSDSRFKDLVRRVGLPQ
jgi:TolB-like protein/DNA-binding winged helix-turn-helix (wHTH) protein/Tfp pilus assembly protein PilF